MNLRIRTPFYIFLNSDYVQRSLRSLPSNKGRDPGGGGYGILYEILGGDMPLGPWNP